MYRILFGVGHYIDAVLTEDDADEVVAILRQPHPRRGVLCVTSAIGLKTFVSHDDLFAISDAPPRIAS